MRHGWFIQIQTHNYTTSNDEESVVGEVITKRGAYGVAIINFISVVWHYNTCIARTPKSSGNYITFIHEATHLLVSHLFMWEHAGVHFDSLGFFMGHGAS